MPRFSIVIPTRARADTLIHALRTAAGQDYADLEILVHECGDDAATSSAVASVADRRLRHVKTYRQVPMAENWERALGCAAGQYITFIGDDDGMLPDACVAAARILDAYPADLLSWKPACYFWPKYLNPEQANRLLLTLRRPEEVKEVDSRIALELFYRFRSDYSSLPMIYNSFVSRALVERVKARAGCYFIGSAPDVTSGIVNAFFAERYLVSGRPLSSSGLSHNSTGHRMHFSADEAVRRQATAQAFSGEEAPSRNLTLLIGDQMQRVKQRLFPDEAPVFHFRNLLWSALQSLHGTFGRYPTMLAEIQDAADRNGISIEDWIEAPPDASPAAAPKGLRAAGDDVFLDMDCATAGIGNIHEVTRLLGALVPACVSPVVVRAAEPLRSIGLGHDTILRFNRDANGLLFLGYGWSEPEAWGIWSLGHSCELILCFQGRPNGPVSIRIAGRMLIHGRRPRADGRILFNGQAVAEFVASQEQPAISVLMTVSPDQFESGELAIRLEMDAVRSPAEDGISADTRRLGFGLEEIAITCAHS